MKPPVIGIALGDPAGVGPEIALQALAAEPVADPTRFVLIGSGDLCRFWNEKLGLRLMLSPYDSPLAPGKIRVLDSGVHRFFGPGKSGDPQVGHAAMNWLAEGAKRCLSGEFAALVTAPVNKEAIINAGYSGFTGQTEFLAEMAGVSRFAMMLLGCDDRARWLRVVLATIHLPLRAVADRLSKEKIELAIEMAAKSCQWLGLARARIGVCGLNPHAGEGGKLGTEEIEIITPVVQAARAQGLEAIGPIAADALFHQAFRGDFDVVVAMYHDQGLAPLKMVAFEQGINWTLGLPFIRTSPDHGTAYNIAGQGVAQYSSMTAAIRLAQRLAASGTGQTRD